MYIPDEKIDEIRAATDIIEVVGDYVRLKKRGSNFVGLCPFHNEKTPSFNVNPNLGIFKCFGCGVGGNVFQFVMQVENVSFPEAARMLAGPANVVLPEERDTEGVSEAESIYAALRFAARFFYEQLTQTPAGKPALAYLQDRGFTPKTIKQFGLGYAPDAWDGLLTAAEGQQIKPEVLEQAGLVIPRKDGSGYYDRYRARVIFPIFSHVGKVLGFGGRILQATDDQPKYINSPETKVYHKSRVLYGLYQGKQRIRRQEEAILVEGYTDVVSLHQAGVAQAVASSGTALTDEQIKLISRYAKRILLLYDADAAGARAALRGIDLILAQGLSVYAVSLPGGEDPDSYVRTHGGAAFEDYVHEHRQDFVSFKLALARRAGAFDTPEGKAEAQRDIVASVAHIPDPLMRDSYLHRASEVLGVPDAQLYQVLKGVRAGHSRQAQRRAARTAPPPEQAPPPPQQAAPADMAAFPPVTRPSPEPLPEEKTLLRLMLEQGNLMVEFILGHMALDEFTEGPAQEIIGGLLEMYEAGTVDAQRFLDETYSPGLQRLAAEVLMNPHEPSENWARKQNITVPRLNEDPYEAAASAMTLLKLDRVEAAMKEVQGQIYRASQDGHDVRPLQERMMHLHALRKQIEQRAFLTADDA